MLNPIYNVFTNNDLLKEITKWHILEYINDSRVQNVIKYPNNNTYGGISKAIALKIINLLSQDKNLTKLTWLLNDKHITIEILDTFTKHCTNNATFCMSFQVQPNQITDCFYNNLTFFEYAYMANSKNILQYFCSNNECRKINLKEKVEDIFEYIPLLLKQKNVRWNDNKDEIDDDPIGGMHWNNVTLEENINTVKICNFLQFYNNLPENNVFTPIILSYKLHNNEIIKKIILDDINCNCKNACKTFCEFCNVKNNNVITPFDDILINCLLKSETITLEFINNNLNNNLDYVLPNSGILYLLYKGFDKSLEYLLNKFPNIITLLNDSHIFKNQRLCDYLICNNCPMMCMLIQKGVTALHNCVLNYLFEYSAKNLISGQPLTNIYTIESTLKKMNIYEQLINILGNKEHTVQLHNFITKNKLLYTDSIVDTIISINSPSFLTKFNNLSIGMKNICFDYLLENKHIETISKIIFDKNLTIKFDDKLNLLIQLGLYDDAFNYICDYDLLKLNIRFGMIQDWRLPQPRNDLVYYDECINRIYLIAKNVELLLNHINESEQIDEVEQKTKILFSKLTNIYIYPSIMVLIKENKKDIFTQIYTYANNTQWKYKIPIEGVINTIAICYSTNFKENYNKLSPETKIICTDYLTHQQNIHNKNNLQLLSEIILDKETVIEFHIKINILLKNKLYDDAIKCIYDCPQNLMCSIKYDIVDIVNYMYKNENNYDNYDIIKLLNCTFNENYNGTSTIFDMLNNLPKYLNENYNRTSTILDMLNTLPKSLNNYCNVFITLCNILNSTKIYESDTLPHFSTEQFVNEYNLSQHLSYFVNNHQDNNIIKNIVAQNMLNIGKIVNFNIENKMIKLTGNMYKKNKKNIHYVIQNIVKRDNDMLFVIFSYDKIIYPSQDISLLELQLFLQKSQYIENYITDDIIYDNFLFKSDNVNYNYYEPIWLFEYFIKNGFNKCLKKYFETFDTKYNRTHIKMAKNKSTLDVLSEYKNKYVKTLQEQIIIPRCI